MDSRAAVQKLGKQPVREADGVAALAQGPGVALPELAVAGAADARMREQHAGLHPAHQQRPARLAADAADVSRRWRAADALLLGADGGHPML